MIFLTELLSEAGILVSESLKTCLLLLDLSIALLILFVFLLLYLWRFNAGLEFKRKTVRYSSFLENNVSLFVISVDCEMFGFGKHDTLVYLSYNLKRVLEGFFKMGVMYTKYVMMYVEVWQAEV